MLLAQGSKSPGSSRDTAAPALSWRHSFPLSILQQPQLPLPSSTQKFSHQGAGCQACSSTHSLTGGSIPGKSDCCCLFCSPTSGSLVSQRDKYFAPTSRFFSAAFHKQFRPQQGWLVLEQKPLSQSADPRRHWSHSTTCIFFTDHTRNAGVPWNHSPTSASHTGKHHCPNLIYWNINFEAEKEKVQGFTWTMTSVAVNTTQRSPKHIQVIPVPPYSLRTPE